MQEYNLLLGIWGKNEVVPDDSYSSRMASIGLMASARSEGAMPAKTPMMERANNAPTATGKLMKNPPLG